MAAHVEAMLHTTNFFIITVSVHLGSAFCASYVLRLRLRFFFFSAFCIIHETWTVHLCMCVWESRLRFPRLAFAFFFFFLVPLVLFMEHEQCIYACVFGKHVLRFPRPAFEFSFSFFSASSTCIYACEQCNAHEQ